MVAINVKDVDSKKEDFNIVQNSVTNSNDLNFDENSTGLTSEFRLLTFNTWGLKYVSKFRSERLVAIADRLASISSDEKQYDIVALQEIWTQEDWDYIEETCRDKYPFMRWFSSGIISGPGLAILSKYPIKRTFLYRFPINGRPSAFFRGDWYVGKSLAVSILQMKENTVAVLNSHMHAPYSTHGDAAYECHRACQAWDIATLANELKEAGHAVILVGDLNSRPDSLQYRILQHEAGLHDSWEIINGKTDLSMIKSMEPCEQITHGGVTCDSTLNTWRADRQPDEACRLDYALIDNSVIRPIDASVEFTEKIPSIGSYSDHFAYSASFSMNQELFTDISSLRKPKNIAENKFNSLNSDLANENIDTCGKLNYATDTLASEKLLVYNDLRSMLEVYMATTMQWQRNWRIGHFAVSLFVFIVFLPVTTAVSYRAPWSSILFVFFGGLILTTGTVNGLIGLLFGWYEERNLKEILLEVDDRSKYLKYCNN